MFAKPQGSQQCYDECYVTLIIIKCKDEFVQMEDQVKLWSLT